MDSQKRKERRENLKAERRCTVCGKQDDATVGGKTLCRECGQAQRDAIDRMRERKKERGECLFCSSPAVPGKRLCQLCAEKSADGYRRRRDRREMKR